MTRTELLKIAKPILFNTEMVRAILEGRKTVTRRVVKLPSHVVPQDNELYTLYAEGTCYENQHLEQLTQYIPKTYQVNDILSVRETYCWCPCWDCGMDTEEHNCCYEPENKRFNQKKDEWGCYCYKASCEDNEYPSVDTWHPSIHMPKDIARIFLKVKDVRVERLQDITEKQAEREGFVDDVEYCVGNTARGHFAELWDTTIDKKQIDIYGWSANPWVWVFEFERIEPDMEV